MEKYRNIIITLSGDPASGKGRVSKQLKKIYTDAGFKVHIISVGDVFRKVVVREYKKMFPHVEEPSLEEIYANVDFASKLQEIDQNIDGEIAKLGEEINSQARPGEVFIFDSRRAWLLIPESFSVRLIVDPEIAGKRVFEDTTRGTEDSYSSLKEATQATAYRRAEEIESCKEQYGLDSSDPKNFNIVMDTTSASIEDVAEAIKMCEERSRINVQALAYAEKNNGYDYGEN